MIKTNTFYINPLIENDANQLFQFIKSNNERLNIFFPVTLACNSTIEKSIEYISIKNREIEEKTNYTFAIKDKNNQQIAGLIIIKKIDWGNKIGELAYCIDSKFEDKGLTSFAVKEMSIFAFNELNLKTLQIIAHKSNIGSCKVALKCGFLWKETLLNEFTPINETPLNMELYELEK